MDTIYMFKDTAYSSRPYNYSEVYTVFSIISCHHIGVNIWAFESCWVGETNPKHMTAVSLKCVGSWGERKSVAVYVNKQI